MRPPLPLPQKPDLNALLSSANFALQRVAVPHVAFLAVCAYGLVIVFGTTDLDLLIGKGNNLPVVDVQVPLLWGSGKSTILCERC